MSSSRVSNYFSRSGCTAGKGSDHSLKKGQVVRPPPALPLPLPACSRSSLGLLQRQDGRGQGDEGQVVRPPTALPLPLPAC